MAYDKFTILKSSAVPLPIENVDTDQIIPARFLKATKREGFGDNLFRDWRYNGDDTPKQDFVLNNPIYSGKILVGGRNFGSGSSRSTLPGRSTITVSVAWFPASLQIFLKVTH
jgi:3-isopropylmalate/(R)-2-methylmalate dehydratase small subunit